MESFLADRHMLYLTSSFLSLYIFGFVVYRLYLHPLAKFPGPKLAAIIRYYEAYYDVIKGGQYTFKIAELHKEYGIFITVLTKMHHESAYTLIPFKKVLSFGLALMSFTSTSQASMKRYIDKMAVGTDILGCIRHLERPILPFVPPTTICTNNGEQP